VDDRIINPQVMYGHTDYETYTPFVKNTIECDENGVFDIGELTYPYSFISIDDDQSGYAIYIKYDSANDDAKKYYVKNTDYASTTTAGVIKVGAGLEMNSSTGALTIQYAKESQIETKQGCRNPLAPQFIDKIIKVGITTNTMQLTDAEKATACTWLGALCDIDTFVIDGGTAQDV
jgi:hypothetical protein